MGVAARWSGAALLLVGACAGAGARAPARVAPPRVPLRTAPPRAPAPTCNDAAALTKKAQRQLADGRALGALAHLDRVPDDCATDKTRALERRVKALLEPPGHSHVAPPALFALAARERAAGHLRNARLLDSRAAYALERDSHAAIALEPWPKVSSARWSPDGHVVAVEASGFASVLDAASGRELCRMKGDIEEFSPDSHWLLLQDPMRLVDIASCKVRLLEAGKDVLDAAFSPHSRHLYWQTDGSHAEIVDLATLKPVQHIAGAGSDFHRFSKSGRYFATVVSRGDHQFVRIIDLQSGRIREQESGDDTLPVAVFAPDGRHVAIRTPADSPWVLEDLATGRVRKLSTRQCSGGPPVVFSASGRYVAIANSHAAVCILDARPRRLVRLLGKRKPSMFPAMDGQWWKPEAFLGDRVVSITNGQYASRVYSLPSGREILRGAPQRGNYAYRLVSRSGNYLVFRGRFDRTHTSKRDQRPPDTAVVDRNGSVRYLHLGLDIDTMYEAKTARPDRGRVLLVGDRFVVLDVPHARALGRHRGSSFAALGPAGKRVLSITKHGVGIWNAETGASGVQLLGRTVEPRALVFDSPTTLDMLGAAATRYSISVARGATASAAPGCHDIAVDLVHGLAVGSDDQGHLAVCRLGSGRILARRSGHAKLPESACFSRDGKHVVVSGQPGSLWDFRKNTWSRLAEHIFGGVASGSGNLVAARGVGSSVLLFNMQTGKAKRTLDGNGTLPLYLDAHQNYLVTGDDTDAYGFDLQNKKRVAFGVAAAAAAINSHGVVALASGNAVVFFDRSGKALGTLRVARSKKGHVSALWQDQAGDVEIAGDRAPWLDSVPCRIGTASVPAGLCFDVLERSGVARRILEGNPPQPAQGASR